MQIFLYLKFESIKKQLYFQFAFQVVAVLYFTYMGIHYVSLDNCKIFDYTHRYTHFFFILGNGAVYGPPGGDLAGSESKWYCWYTSEAEFKKEGMWRTPSPAGLILDSDLEDCQESAQEARLGLWAYDEPVAPWVWRKR